MSLEARVESLERRVRLTEIVVKQDLASTTNIISTLQTQLLNQREHFMKIEEIMVKNTAVMEEMLLLLKEEE